ncbi:leucyl aminopeptidase [Scopulibacillus darangshiensis]|uniref:Probable cytosol aminopeptidase n=1 Tax=Scopulibacillus darangshiensis TaxID=442528 RepID=A0A4R2P4I1_9BACL|nr:leucyl aminopeptidase family protein [Scopulibacillus darangshiensis]TCP29557.1 leucyl aminopeptidase [Scopulibacillus darangshiensis]
MEKLAIQLIRSDHMDKNNPLWHEGIFDFGQITPAYTKEQYLLYAGVKKNPLTLDDVRHIAGEISKFIKSKEWSNAHLDLDHLTQTFPEYTASQLTTAFYEGWYLGQYTFSKYKKDKKGTRVELYMEGQDDDCRQTALCRSDAVKATRDLCNEPPNVLNPDTYDVLLQDIFQDSMVEITVHTEDELQSLELNGILSVARGSHYSPKLIQLSYCGSDEAPHIALVGKGVTFDTGGINAKSGDFADMKMDMGGSAAVVGAVKLLSGMEARVNVTALIPVVDNVPDARSLLPSEIIQYKNNVSVQVVNTDAEGRLILADALLFAQELGAVTVVDIATLTGSIGHALGLKVAGVWSNNNDLSEKMKAIGSSNGDHVWPMPLVTDYDEWLKNPYADISNVGTSPFGGAITAAVFLNHFINPSTKWLHIDMANTVQSWKAFGYYTSGASGYGARLLADFVLGEIKNEN